MYRDGSVAAGNWLRLSEDLVDSVTQRFVVPFNGTRIQRVTLACSPFTASTQQIEIYRNGVLISTTPLASTVLHQIFTVDIPVNQADLLGIFIRRTAGAGLITDPCVTLYGG